MGLGLSALVALLLLLPGLAFVLGLSRVYSPASPATPFDQHFSVGLLAAILAALAFHLLGLAVGFGAAAWFDLPAPSPAQAIALLAGQLDHPVGRAALATLERHPLRVGGYLLILTVAAGWIGRRLNPHMPTRDTVAWTDLLDRDAGPEVAFIVLTAEVTHGGRTYLYSGFVDDYRTDRSGRLERIAFRGYAARRPLEADAGVVGAPDAWVQIPGERFVLEMRDVHTVNVDYYYAVDDDEADGEGSLDEDAAPAA